TACLKDGFGSYGILLLLLLSAMLAVRSILQLLAKMLMRNLNNFRHKMLQLRPQKSRIYHTS
ncbi:MAG: hypothetical protein AAF585_09335, partial [Verrucomicrobiota bacterium]